MPGPFRKTDAVLTIAQDNIRQAIEVTAANDIASKVFGYSIEELKGKAFRDLVPAKIADQLNDYVEYETGGNDVGEVLRKVRDFQLQGKDGKAAPYKLKVVRHHSQQLDEFLLIMQDAAHLHETNAFLEMLRQNREGHASLNPDTGLLDRSTFTKALELVALHLDTFKQGCCVAVVQLDEYEKLLGKYGKQACHKMLQNAAGLCQQNLRTNDVVAQVAKDRIGLVLLGADPEAAKMVLNRLRWLLSSMNTRTQQGVDVQSTATIAFHPMVGGKQAEEYLETCEKIFTDKPDSSKNLVVQV